MAAKVGYSPFVQSKLTSRPDTIRAHSLTNCFSFPGGDSRGFCASWQSCHSGQPCCTCMCGNQPTWATSSGRGARCKSRPSCITMVFPPSRRAMRCGTYQPRTPLDSHRMRPSAVCIPNPLGHRCALAWLCSPPSLPPATCGLVPGCSSVHLGIKYAPSFAVNIVGEQLFRMS